MDDEVLIDQVREHSCLYDMTHSKYLDTNFKSFIWRRIGEQIQLNEESCKKRWRNIRDQFKKTLNKRKTQCGKSAKSMKKYKYEETLQFLIPYIQDRDTISIIEDDNELTTNKTEGEERTNIVASNETLEQIHESTDSPPTSLHQLTSTSSRRGDSHSVSFTNVDQRHRNRVNVRKLRSIRAMKQVRPQKKASNTLMKYLIEQKEKSRTELHPIEAFFQGLIPTVKRFSPYYQHIAKGRIFSLVQELEYEQIRQSRPNLQDMQPPVYESSSNSTSIDEHTLCTTVLSTDEAALSGNLFSQ